MNIYVAYFLVGIVVLFLAAALPFVFTNDDPMESKKQVFKKWFKGIFNMGLTVAVIAAIIYIMKVFILAFITVSEHLG